MSKPKKKFKETAVGKFILKKLPSFIGGILPNDGILGVVKNLIDNEPDMTPEQRNELHNELIELYKIEVDDRESARKRETEIAKTGRVVFIFYLNGNICLGSFAFIIYAIVYLTIPESNKEVWIHLIGICEGIVLSIFGYFFGSAIRQNNN
jgi:hypothetical protein